MVYSARELDAVALPRVQLAEQGCPAQVPSGALYFFSSALADSGADAASPWPAVSELRSASGCCFAVFLVGHTNTEWKAHLPEVVCGSLLQSCVHTFNPNLQLSSSPAERLGF